MYASRLKPLRTLQCLLLALLALPGQYPSAQILTMTDDFTQGSVNDNSTSKPNWAVIGPACLTAGIPTNLATSKYPANNDGPGSTTTSTFSNIPSCAASPSTSGISISGSGNNVGSTPDAPDPVGGGALRLTSNINNQAGAIVSQNTFPSGSGVQVTFTGYAYGGTGADGMGFFMQDATYPVVLPYAGGDLSETTPYNIGESGGSLGYSCSNYKSANTNYNGLTGGYVGLGMDEYGNFLNGGSHGSGDNTATGILNGTRYPNTIGLRGAGNVSWYWLNTNYPDLYPTTLSAANQLAAVEATCVTGTLHNYGSYSGTSQSILGTPTIATPVKSGSSISTPMTVTVSGIADYHNNDNVTLAGISALPFSQSITSTSVTTSGSTSTLKVTVPSVAYFVTSQSVTLSGLADSATQSITGTPTLSGTSMTVTVPNISAYSTAQTVTFTGLTAVANVSAATIGSGGLTVSLPSTSGYSFTVGDSVSLAGATATTKSQSLTGLTCTSGSIHFTVSNTAGFSVNNKITIGGATGSPSINGTSLTVTSVSTSSGSGTVTASVSGVSSGNCPTSSNYSNATVSSTVPVAGNITGIKTVNSTSLVLNVTTALSNTSFTLAGATLVDTSISPLTGVSFGVQNVSSGSGSGTFKVTLPGSYSAISVAGATATNSLSVNGSYTAGNISSSNNTFTVTLPSVSPISSGSLSGTGLATLPTSAVSGSYAISGVTTTGGNTSFTVNVSGVATSLSASNATVTDTSNSGAADMGVTSLGGGPTLMDYAMIPNGYVTLPSSTPIASSSSKTRAAATPITYRLSITPGGLMSFMYAYNGATTFTPVLTNFPIATSNGPLPSYLRFGFLGSTGGDNNVHELTCFRAEPNASTSSAGVNTVQTGQVKTGTNVYTAVFNAGNWTSTLVSTPLTVDSSGNLSSNNTVTWDASCTLTGGACQTMAVNGVSPNISVTAPASRHLLSWSGSAGEALEWGTSQAGSGLTTAQQAVLNTSYNSYTNGQNRLDWLRGGRGNEPTATPPGLLRARVSVLGDILNSSPVWVGPPSLNYASVFTDALYGSNGGESAYSSFASGLATRQNVVYVGANDGYLHGFRAGSKNADGSNNSANDDGVEVLGFMPGGILSNTNNPPTAPNPPYLDVLADPTYGHDFFVDAAPGTGDLYYGGAWHSWLVGGLGFGGREIYALDITDPTGSLNNNKAFSETNASNIVINDWTSASLTSLGCVNVGSGQNCGDNLGNTYGTPLVRRMHNGQWAIIFGNGFGSANNVAGIYIGVVNSTSGAVTFYWLSTGTGSSAAPDGIGSVSSADLDGDHVADYLYGGDLLGNVWRFDVTSSNPADWAVSKYGRSGATPLFTATNSSGLVQPITTAIVPTVTYTGGAQRVILGFGTGRVFPISTFGVVSYTTSSQSVYGIWDWDMSIWNTGHTTAHNVVIPASSTTLDALPETSAGITISRSTLLQNTIVTNSANSSRYESVSTVGWVDCSTCAATSGTAGTQYGWYADLPGTAGTGAQTNYEQAIYTPRFFEGLLIFNTALAPSGTSVQCASTAPAGFEMGFDMATGGGQAFSIMPGISTSQWNGMYVMGTQNNAVGTPSIVSVGTTPWAVSPTSTGGVTNLKVKAVGAVKVRRVSLEQIR